MAHLKNLELTPFQYYKIHVEHQSEKSSLKRYLVDCTFTQRWRSRFEMQMRSCKRRPCLSRNDVEMSVAVGKNGACMLLCKHDNKEFAYTTGLLFFFFNLSVLSFVFFCQSMSRCLYLWITIGVCLTITIFYDEILRFQDGFLFSDPKLTSAVHKYVHTL